MSGNVPTATWHPPAHIRVLAIGVIRHGDRILAAEGFDPSKPETFYRPPGGAVEMGERAEDALRREFREELGMELGEIHYLDTLENLFSFDGVAGHEYVRVYLASAADASLYRATALIGHEEDGSAFNVEWLDLDRARRGEVPLYPDGLLDLLDPNDRRGAHA